MQDSFEDDEWLQQYAIDSAGRRINQPAINDDDEWLKQYAIDSAGRRINQPAAKKGIGKVGQTALGVAEGTMPSIIGKAFNTLVKGAARNAFAEEKENDLFNAQAYGLEMPELDQKAFEEQLKGLEKKLPTTPSNILESIGLDTEPQDTGEELLRGAGFGGALAGKGAIAKALGGAAGAAFPQVVKALGLPPEAEEAIGDMFDLTLLAHRRLGKAEKIKPKAEAPKVLPEASEALIYGEMEKSSNITKPVIEALEEKRMAEAAEMEKAAEGSVERKLDEMHAKKMEAYEKKRTAAEQRAREKHIKKMEEQEKADRASEIKENANRLEKITDEVFPSESKNKSILSEGRALSKAIKEYADSEHKRINDLYEEAKFEQSGVLAKRQSLVRPLADFIQEVRNIPRETLPKGAARAADFAEGVLRFAAKGEEIGNDQLIKLEKSLNEIMQYDIKPHPTGVFQPLKKIIADEIKNTSTPEAYEKYKAAKDAYADWSERFQNEIVEPWRDRGNLRHDVMLKRAINNTSDLESIANAVQPKDMAPILNRALKEKLRDAAKKGDKAAYDAALKEFENALPQEARDVFEGLSPKAEGRSNAHSAPFSFTYPYEPPPRPTYKGAKRGAQYKKETHESILSKMQTYSGIKALEKEMGVNSPELIKLKQHTAQQLLTNGKIPSEVKVEDFSRVLKDSQKRDLLQDLTSAEYVSDLEKFVEEYKGVEAEIEESKMKEAQKAEFKKGLWSLAGVALVGAFGLEKIAYYVGKLRQLKKSMKKQKPKEKK